MGEDRDPFVVSYFNFILILFVGMSLGWMAHELYLEQTTTHIPAGLR